MLEVRHVNAFYGNAQALWNVDIDVRTNEIVAVMGPNGSGKSTILKAIMGLVSNRSGDIRLLGTDLEQMPTHQRVKAGISFVLERRRLFPMMTVAENLRMGAFAEKDRARIGESLEWVESLFPILAARRSQLAGRMSGGEQQMVAIARGLMSRPKLLLLDEPFLGLAPRIVDQVMGLIHAVNEQGVAILFNEQNVHLSFSTAHRGYLLENGRVLAEGRGSEMLHSQIVRDVYLGHGRVQ